MKLPVPREEYRVLLEIYLAAGTMMRIKTARGEEDGPIETTLRGYLAEYDALIKLSRPIAEPDPSP